LSSSFITFVEQLGQNSGGLISISDQFLVSFITEITLGITSQALFIKILSQMRASRFFISS
jgi:hypothetical protein